MRLIDADALLDDGIKVEFGYDHDGLLTVPLRDVHNSIRNAPTVDAVPVIRCKDCKHYKYRMCELIGNIMDGYYHGTFDVKRPDDFCSYGVKKSGGGENAAD